MRDLTEQCLRIVGWNCNMALRGKKADALLGLEPDVAVVAECAEMTTLPGLDRIRWTGKYPNKGLGVFARPVLRATVDAAAMDETLEWFLPVRVGALDLDVLAVWAMNQRGGTGPGPWRTRRALGHYAPLLARGRAVVIGDFNDNVQWDTPNYPAFAGTLDELAAKGYVSLYHAMTGQRHGEETAVSLYWKWHRDAPYLVDHAFAPVDWLGAVEQFEILPDDPWLALSDHMPLVLDLRLPLPAAAIGTAVRTRVPEPPRA